MKSNQYGIFGDDECGCSRQSFLIRNWLLVEMGCEDPIETVLSAADEFGVKFFV